jgi:hypothetical protein
MIALVAIVNESRASTEDPLPVTQGSGPATNVIPGECIWSQGNLENRERGRKLRASGEGKR